MEEKPLPVPLGTPVQQDGVRLPLHRFRMPFLGRRLPQSVPCSLTVVENFFGAELSERMVQAANSLSEPQLEELRAQLFAQNLSQRRALESERGLLPLEEELAPLRKSLRRSEHKPLLESIISSMTLVRGGYDHLRTVAEVHTHEDSLFTAGVKTDVQNVQALKYLALYCDRVVVRDPLYIRNLRFTTSIVKNVEGLPFEQQRFNFADGLRQLLPIVDLVRSGCFVLSGDDADHQAWWQKSTMAGSVPDPFFSWIVRQHRPDLYNALSEDTRDFWERCRKVKLQPDATLEPAIRRKADTFVLGDEILDATMRLYPYDIARDELEVIRKMAYQIYTYNLTPVTSNPAIARHLLQSARVLLNGQPDMSDGPVPASTFSPALAYGIPSLADVSFSSIAQLRKNEAVFAHIRDALNDLSAACAQTAQPDSYEAYKQVIREQAQDAIGPAYTLLKAMHRRNAWKKLGITAASEIAGLGVDAIAGMLPLDSVVTRTTEHLAGKGPRQQRSDTALACRILRSILLTPHKKQ